MRYVVRFLLVLALVGSGVLGSAGSGTAARSAEPTPVARPDSIQLRLGGSGPVKVLANDTCGDVTPCRAAIGKVRAVSVPSGLRAVASSTGVITVTVTGGRIRDARITYQLTEGGISATSSIAVRIRQPSFAPSSFTPARGARFNNPLGTVAAKNNIVSNVVRTIDAVPGYRVGSRAQCPSDRSLFPAEIKISLYSVASTGFADALVRADRRCVSVQLLMNNHLNATTSHSWGKILHAVGNHRSARSFTWRCAGSCRGTAVLHSKFYLFSAAGRARNVVMVGSSNMTTNATHVQWNDLYTTYGANSTNATLYGQYRSIFQQMVPDRPVPNPLRQFTAGPYRTTFWPFPGADEQTDTTMRDLRSIHCTGATGGSGINGRTLVLINMHAWHSERGVYIARQVRRLYAQGCYIRILYSFMGHPIFTQLTAGTGSRMVARRTIFPHPHSNVAAVYSHQKFIAVSGRVGSDSAAWVVWTGSNNFSNLARHDDEVTMRIPFRSAFAAYRIHFDFMTRRKSAANWAIYQEPGGGGRRPRLEAAGGLSPMDIHAPGEVH